MITIYTSDTCPNCIKVEKYLNDNEVPYMKKQVNGNSEKAAVYTKELLSRGYLGVPLTVYLDKEVVGFDKEGLDEIINAYEG